MDAAFLSEAEATYRISEKAEMLFKKIGLAEPSIQYFRSRQVKFIEKAAEDEEQRPTPKKKNMFGFDSGTLPPNVVRNPD